jgi:hypothetical protein
MIQSFSSKIESWRKFHLLTCSLDQSRKFQWGRRRGSASLSASSDRKFGAFFLKNQTNEFGVAARQWPWQQGQVSH